MGSVKILSSRFSILPLVLALANCSNSAPSVILDMEIAYPVYGNLSGASKVWAVYRVPLSAGSELAVGDDVEARVQCAASGCHIEGLLRQGTPSSKGGMLLASKVIAIDTQSVILLPASFPERVDSQFASRVSFNQTRTPLVKVSYSNHKGSLEFREITLTGSQQRPPIRWK